MKFFRLLILLVLVSIAEAPVYAKNEKDKVKKIPPGLQKKVEQGKPLPPGWQKKLVKGETMDRAVYERSRVVVPVDERGILTVQIEGKLVKLYRATREIIEVLDQY